MTTTRLGAKNSDTTLIDDDATLATSANIPTAGAVAGADASVLAVPRRVLTGQIVLSTAALSATNYPAVANAAANMSTLAVSNTGVTIAKWRCDTTQLPALDGKNPLLRLTLVTGEGTVSPNITMTAGIYPLTVSSNSWAIGSVVGSTASHVLTGTSAPVVTVLEGLSLPTTGIYTVVGTISGTPGANNYTDVFIDLYYG